MGFELGPKLLRNAPRGWLPARAFSESHAVSSHHYGDEGPPEIETSMHLRVTWRVEVPGREPYELQEERSVPNWLGSGGIVGNGNRWYKVRVRPQYGLIKSLGVPCVVNPGDPSEIWIDWDASYKEHEPAWDREARIRREVERRKGGIDAALSRIGNPLVGKARPEDEEDIQARLEREQRPLGAPVANPFLEAQAADIKARIAELERVQKVGRKTTGIVVSRAETGRRLSNIPAIDLVFEIEGRQVAFEHVFGPRHGNTYMVGRRVEVWVDPEDPDNICPGRGA